MPAKAHGMETGMFAEKEEGEGPLKARTPVAYARGKRGRSARMAGEGRPNSAQYARRRTFAGAEEPSSASVTPAGRTGSGPVHGSNRPRRFVAQVNGS